MKPLMATTAKVVFSHITKNPNVCGGKACIDNTRIRVIDIVQAHSEGKTPQQIQDLFAVKLSLAQVYSALAYADEHPEEIAGDFAADVVTDEEIERDRAAYFARQRSR